MKQLLDTISILLFELLYHYEFSIYKMFYNLFTHSIHTQSLSHHQ